MGAVPIVETQVAKGTHSSVFRSGMADGSGFEICGVYEFVGYWESRVESISRRRKVHFSGRREDGVVMSFI